MIATEDWGAIKTLKAKKPSRSYRKIARLIGVSPNTVINARARDEPPAYKRESPHFMGSTFLWIPGLSTPADVLRCGSDACTDNPAQRLALLLNRENLWTVAHTAADQDIDPDLCLDELFQHNPKLVHEIPSALGPPRLSTQCGDRTFPIPPTGHLLSGCSESHLELVRPVRYHPTCPILLSIPTTSKTLAKQKMTVNTGGNDRQRNA